jgi:hypothetical protein
LLYCCTVSETKAGWTASILAAADAGGDKEMKRWQSGVIEVGCWYVSMAGQKSDEEFEVIAKEEHVLKGMYTISETSQ